MLALSLIISAQNIEKKCKSCRKPISQCQYKGRHPVSLRNPQTQLNSSQNQQQTQQGKHYQQSLKKVKVEDYVITGFSELCPDENHPHAIDLGLPSGTRWACCNVEASEPYEGGGYYAWGEIAQKSKYDWTSYKHCQGSHKTTTSIHGHGINDISKSISFDAAFNVWGYKWSIPSSEACKELKEHCSFKRALYHGVKGALLIGPNGMKLFLPIDGNRTDGTEDEDSWRTEWDNRGTYWSSKQDGLASNAFAHSFYFDKAMKFSATYRCYGLHVRPVANFDEVIETLLKNMVFVEGDSFIMGSNDGDSYSGEKSHKEAIVSFSIGKYEVTQEEWETVMGTNPSEFKGGKHPVENVSWDDCQVFIEKLNEMTNEKFRLPTEAEWEYAARGGKLSKGYRFAGGNSLDSIAVYDEISRKKGKDSPDYGTHNVGTLKPNELGLYDMSGNVDEWCLNSHTATMLSGRKVEERAHRGGNWFCFSNKSTEAMFDLWRRGFLPQGNKYDTTGLRLVR